MKTRFVQQGNAPVPPHYQEGNSTDPRNSSPHKEGKAHIAALDAARAEAAVHTQTRQQRRAAARKTPTFSA